MDTFESGGRRRRTEEIDTKSSKPQQPLSESESDNLLALSESDPTTHALLAGLVASLNPNIQDDHDDPNSLAMLMTQMDNTLDALGEIESRAEDILGKLDAFLAENGCPTDDYEDDDDEIMPGPEEEDARDAMDSLPNNDSEKLV